MPIKPLEAIDMLENSHEERLQTVESAITQMATQVTEIAVKQDHFKETLTEGITRVESCLDKLVSRITDQDSRIEALDKKIEPIQKFVDEELKSQSARADTVKKIIFSLVLTGSGALLNEIVKHFWK